MKYKIFTLNLLIPLIILLNNNLTNANLFKTTRKIESTTQTPLISLEQNNMNKKFSNLNEELKRELSKSYIQLSALNGKSVMFTCSIDIDNVNFTKSNIYRIIWSKETENGSDYEPLFFHDSRLTFDPRFTANHLLLNKQTHIQLQWNLVINNLRLSDSKNYMCQLNREPYHKLWLKKFLLNVYEPASFLNDNENGLENNEKDKFYVKNVNEHTDFKLQCLARGKPKPTVNWFLKYLNGTTIPLDIDNSEILIKNIKRSSKLDKIECQVSNGFGPAASRSFKINIKHMPHPFMKSKIYRVALRTNEVKLNCSFAANPASPITWLFMPRRNPLQKYDDHEYFAWTLINSMASFFDANTGLQSSDTTSSAIAKLSLSKYQIYEKTFHHNHINSILIIKIINEKDYGTYRCIASNEFGNRSTDFKLEELNFESHHSNHLKSNEKHRKKSDEDTSKRLKSAFKASHNSSLSLKHENQEDDSRPEIEDAASSVEYFFDSPNHTPEKLGFTFLFLIQFQLTSIFCKYFLFV